MPKVKKWIGERAGAIAALLFVTSLVLYGVAFLIEKGLSALSPATVTAAVATALLLASVSVTIERYIKTSLTDPEIEAVLRARQLGLERIQERNVTQGLFTGLPKNLLAKCTKELLVLAYSADNFVVRNSSWIVDAVKHGKHVGLLILHPDDLDQAKQTERRDLRSQIETTLGLCEKVVADCADSEGSFDVRGFAGHFYYTGIFVDRYIFSGSPDSVHVGPVCVQLKANYRSQHEGIVLTFRRDSRFADFYSASCRELWSEADELLPRANETNDRRTQRL
ncbi:MAG: hypothetical protein MPN21_17815 [Thermoanaerobaculia bacterium]|nr:hypothetical protein [Thermoanaerobaculia bacterium]